ncbi:MAG TPA: permease-like cell division protein FtsX [Mycobacteriales bacterium]|nr:permease-like cell division protein FtsX [Mycobacteriales bacterium]
MRANFVLTEVATGLRRNLTMTIAMIITTAISLGLFGAGLLIANEIGQMKQIYFDKVEVSVYLNDDITTAQRTDLQKQLSTSPEVTGVNYLDKKQAYTRFKKLFEAQPELISAVGPNDLPASFQVKLRNAEQFDLISQEFNSAPGVQQVQAQSDLLNRLFGLLNGLRNATIALAVIQALAALLLISNTIQVAAFTRRTETGIMRLVGASRWYTQLPFLLEAAVAGLIGALLALGMLFLGKLLFIDKTLAAPIKAGIIPKVGWDAILAISPVVAGAGVVLAGVAAYVTLRLYVRL